MNICESLHDPRFFFEAMKGGRETWTWGGWEIYLKALFGLPIEDPEGRRLFTECTGLTEPPTERARESFVICGRRSGKSFVSSVVAVFLATFKDWTKVLGPGEVGWIFILSVDKMQSGIIKNYIKALLDGSPNFRKLLRNETREVIELNNQVNIGVKTSSFRSVRGYTILAAVLEELAFWRSEESANPDFEVLTAVRPALSTVKDSLMIAISTPYSRSGLLWQTYKDSYGQTGGPLVWRAPSLVMNPTLNAGMIEQELTADPEAARAEWLGEFRSDISAFIPSELIEAVTISGRYELPKVEGVQYFGFTDSSSGRQDSFTLGIAHRSPEGRVVLDVLHERRPPFSPESVVSEYVEILKTYGLATVQGDKFGAEFVVELFRKHGILYQPSEKTASELYLEFLPMLTTGSVELLDQKRLRGQLAGLERKTRAGGKDVIGHGPGLHDDVVNSAAGVCVMAGLGREKRLGSVSFAGKKPGPEKPKPLTPPPSKLSMHGRLGTVSISQGLPQRKRPIEMSPAEFEEFSRDNERKRKERLNEDTDDD